MHVVLARRAGWRAIALLLALAVLAAATFTAWSMSQAQEQPQAVPGRTIDWAHQVRIPGPGMALSGVGSPATGDILAPLAQTGSNAQAIAPHADFPRCYRGYAYLIIVKGVEVWTATSGHLRASVEYLWCQRYAGDQIGINFSYGRSYNLASTDQRLGFGQNMPWGWLGAMIFWGMNQEAFDGEAPVSYAISPGSYAWDYSVTVPGNGFYSVGERAFDLSNDTSVQVWSPCCY